MCTLKEKLKEFHKVVYLQFVLGSSKIMMATYQENFVHVWVSKAQSPAAAARVFFALTSRDSRKHQVV